MQLNIPTRTCDYCGNKLISPLVLKGVNIFCNNNCFKLFDDPNAEIDIEIALDNLSKIITDKLQTEKIALSKAVVSRDSNNKFKITFFEGVGAIKTEFAIFRMKKDKLLGWRSSSHAKNTTSLPISKTLLLSEYLREIVENIFDEEGGGL